MIDEFIDTQNLVMRRHQNGIGVIRFWMTSDVPYLAGTEEVVDKRSVSFRYLCQKRLVRPLHGATHRGNIASQNRIFDQHSFPLIIVPTTAFSCNYPADLPNGKLTLDHRTVVDDKFSSSATAAYFLADGSFKRHAVSASPSIETQKHRVFFLLRFEGA